MVERRGEIFLRESIEYPNDLKILVLPDKPVEAAGEIKRRHPFFVHGNSFHFWSERKNL